MHGIRNIMSMLRPCKDCMELEETTSQVNMLSLGLLCVLQIQNSNQSFIWCNTYTQMWHFIFC